MQNDCISSAKRQTGMSQSPKASVIRLIPGALNEQRNSQSHLLYIERQKLKSHGIPLSLSWSF